MTTRPENYLRVGGCRIDIDAVLRLEHRCEPRLCRRSGSCCAAHDAWIGGEERDRLIRWLPRAAEWAPHLHAASREACRRLGPDLFVIEKTPGGLCIFAFEGEDGGLLCSLHAAAVQGGEAPERVKPRGCVLWPLCESGSQPPVISVQPGAEKFPCNQMRTSAGPLHPGTAELVRRACGVDFVHELRQKLPASLLRDVGSRFGGTIA